MEAEILNPGRRMPTCHTEGPEGLVTVRRTNGTDRPRGSSFPRPKGWGQDGALTIAGKGRQNIRDMLMWSAHISISANLLINLLALRLAE